MDRYVRGTVDYVRTGRRRCLSVLCAVVMLAGELFLSAGHAQTAASLEKSVPPAVFSFDRALAEGSLSFVLNRTLELNFTPERAVFFVDFSGEMPRRLAGIVLPALGSEGGEAAPHKWIVGALLHPPAGCKKVRYVLLVLGKARQFFFDPQVSVELTAETPEIISADDLRDRLLQKKETLKSWQIQLTAQKDSLQRLREDASVIGNLGRIIEVKDEIERTRMSMTSLERDLEHMRDFVKIARQRPQPKNYPLREGELTRQLAELAEAAKNAESQEFSRKSHAEGDLQRKLSIIEQTRNDDYDELQRELLRVRRQRLQLEKEKGVSFERDRG